MCHFTVYLHLPCLALYHKHHETNAVYQKLTQLWGEEYKYWQSWSKRKKERGIALVQALCRATTWKTFSLIFFSLPTITCYSSLHVPSLASLLGWVIGFQW